MTRLLITALLMLSGTQSHAELTKLGSGSAYWGPLKLYDASFYADTTAAANYLDDAVPAKLTLCYARKLKVQNFIDGANHALPKNLSVAHRQAVNKLHASYQPVSKGDCYTLDYTPNAGTKLVLNGKTLNTIQTAGFKRVYFGIWLGDKPLSNKLKNQLLGR